MSSKAPRRKAEDMKNDLEIELYLREMFGLQDRNEQSRAKSIQKSTDAVDAFFEQLDIDGYRGPKSTGVSNAVAEVLGYEPNRNQPELDDLRNFVKAEKQRVPTMTSREVRGSVVNFLRKAADAMAAP